MKLFYLISILSFINFVHADYTCTVTPPLPALCGCYTDYVVHRPTCATETAYWCSSNLACNGGTCTGSVKIGSWDYCKTYAKYGRLIMQEVENCQRAGVNRKVYAYLGTTTGENYASSPIVINEVVPATGTFKVSTSTKPILTFYIGKNQNKFIAMVKTTTYYLTASDNTCASSSWVASVVKSITNGIIVDDKSSDLVDGCTCQYVGTVPPTPSPTEIVYPSYVTGPSGSGALTYELKPGKILYILQSENGLWRFGLDADGKMSFWKYNAGLWVFDHYMDTYKSTSGSLTATGNLLSIDYTGNFALINKGTMGINWETGSSKMNAGGKGQCTLSIAPDGTISLLRVYDSFIYWNSRQPIARAWSDTNKSYAKEYLFLKNGNWEFYFGADGALHLFLSGVQKWVSPAGSYFKFRDDGNLIVYNAANAIVWAALNYPRSTLPSMIELSPTGEIKIRSVVSKQILWQCVDPWTACPTGKKV